MAENKKSGGKIIGIDLGTTNSVVAVVLGGNPTVIPNDEGRNVTPSVVAFMENGEIKVGDPAKRQAILNPENTIFSIKRFMGRRYSEVQDEIKRVPYKVVQGPNDTVLVEVRGKRYTPQQISAFILQKLKRVAEEYLGHEVTEAVITVPAYFDDSQRKATKEAGEIAGLTVRRILNEPTAAALAYGLDKKGKELKVAVYDLGGGTFDVSILEIGEGVYEVKATHGDTHLGGDDFDNEIINWLAEEFLKEEGIDLRKDPMAMQRLKEAAEKAKIELSSSYETEINLPYITAKDGVPKHLVRKLTRAQFERMIDPYIKRTLESARIALEKAKLRPEDIDEVVLVGGSTRIPAVQKAVEDFFGKKPHKGINPDEVVAVGAAIQASVLAGEMKDILLLDVTPLSLGVETYGGVFHVLIPAGTTIPTRKTEIFTTAADNQTTVEIHVLQGERAVARENRSLGRFYLEGIPPAPRGVPQIEVTFDIDANGILHVTARDKATGKEKSIRIEGSTGLSKEEIERMKAEAQKYAEQDRKFREKVEKLNRADQLIYTTEKQLQELGSKLRAEQRERLQKLLHELKEAHKKEDLEAIDRLMNELTRAWQEVSATLYQEASASSTGTTTGTSTSTTTTTSGGEVRDVEYEEVKEEERGEEKK